MAKANRTKQTAVVEELERKTLITWEELQARIDKEELSELEAARLWFSTRMKTNSKGGSVDYRPMLIIIQALQGNKGEAKPNAATAAASTQQPQNGKKEGE